MAVDMAAMLGFSDQAIAQMAETEYDKTILQATWTCVNILHGALRSGKPPSFSCEPAASDPTLTLFHIVSLF